MAALVAIEEEQATLDAPEAALWAWYLEWSQIARIAVTQRASASCPRQPPMWTESVRSLPLAASTSGLLPRRGAYWNSQQPSSGGGRVALE